MDCTCRLHTVAVRGTHRAAREATYNVAAPQALGLTTLPQRTPLRRCLRAMLHHCASPQVLGRRAHSLSVAEHSAQTGKVSVVRVAEADAVRAAGLRLLQGRGPPAAAVLGTLPEHAAFGPHDQAGALALENVERAVAALARVQHAPTFDVAVGVHMLAVLCRAIHATEDQVGSREVVSVRQTHIERDCVCARVTRPLVRAQVRVAVKAWAHDSEGNGASVLLSR